MENPLLGESIEGIVLIFFGGSLRKSKWWTLNDINIFCSQLFSGSVRLPEVLSPLVSHCLPTCVPVLDGASAFPRPCLPLSPIVSPHVCLYWMLCLPSQVSPCLPLWVFLFTSLSWTYNTIYIYVCVCTICIFQCVLCIYIYMQICIFICMCVW